MTITIGDLNDESPVWVSSATQSINENTQNVVALSATDADSGDSVSYSITTNDNSLFEISSGTLRLVASGGANYESPGCGSSSNTCTVTVLASDGASTANTASRTFTITIDDVNDQAPTYTGGDITPSVTEGQTPVDSFTIVDTDTGDVNSCSLGGADSALFSCTLSGTSDDSVSIAFITEPDYENPGSAAGTNVYDLTATISDGVNTGGTLAYTVTVIDGTGLVIPSGQTGSVSEDASAGTTVVALSITDATPDVVLIGAGNDDGIFAVSNAGVITVADVTNLNYEVTNSYTLTIVAYDTLSSDVEDVTITIVNANDAPDAGAAQTGSVTEDATATTATGTVAATDEDTSDTLSYAIDTAAGTYGTLTMSGAAWTYTIDNSAAATTALDAGDAPTEVFTITVSDTTATDTMTITITVNGADDAVDAGAAQTGSVTEDGTSTATGTVAATDPDADSAFTYGIGTAAGTYGSLAIDSAGAWTYTIDNSAAATNALDAGDAPTEVFTITVTDTSSTLTDTMTVTITVNGADDAVDAGAAQTGSVTEDGTSTATGTVAATDPDADSALTYGIGTAAGTYGSLAIDSTGAWTYTIDNSAAATNALDAGDAPTEVFTITVTDTSSTLTDTMTVTITVNGADDAVDAGAAQTGSVTEDGTSTATGTVAATDPDADSAFTYGIGTAAGTYGSLAIDSAGAWTYTIDNSAAATNALDAGDTPTDAFTITVTDTSSTLTDTMTVTITVNGADDAVDAGPAQTGAVTEDATATTATGTVAATDPDADSAFTYAIGTAAGTYGSLAIDSAGAWTYTIDNSAAATNALDAGDAPTEVFTITVTDTSSTLTDTMTVTITVNGADDAVDAGAAQTGSVTEDGTSTATGTVAATDPDADSAFTYGIGTAAGTYGSLAIDSAGAWTYTIDNSAAATNALDAGDTPTDAFTITVTDTSSTLTDTMTVTITVNGADDAVDAGPAQTGAVTEDATATTATGTVAATDPDADSAFTYAIGTAAGTYGSLAIDSAGAWTYTIDNSAAATHALAHDGSGSDAFTITVTDTSSTLTDTMTVTVTVSGANDAPTVASTISDASTDEDSPYSLDISSNFADPDTGDGLTYTATGLPGDLTMSSAGVITGTPVNADVGPHTVTVTATDDGATPGETVSSSYTITVVNTDDPTVGSTVPGTSYTIDAVDDYGDGGHVITVTGSDGTVLCTLGTYSSSWSSSWPAASCTFEMTSGTADVVYTGGEGYASELTVTVTSPSGATSDASPSANYGPETVATLTELSIPDMTTLVVITGDLYDGATLTADTQYLTDDDGMGTFTYQWANQDGDITGAISDTYMIPSCDTITDGCSTFGNTYTVNVTHIDAYSVSQVMPTTDATSGVTLNPAGDLDGDTIPNNVDTDDDGDGWIDTSDAFPTDSDEWLNTDGSCTTECTPDDIGNNEDTDDDGDGVADGPDDFPLDHTEQWDADNDGWGHNADSDDDGDGLEDWEDPDTDGDGYDDATDDAYPHNYNEWNNTDASCTTECTADAVGDNEDTDDDGDGVLDTADAFPRDYSESVDTDGDGIGNNADLDDDADGTADATDVWPLDPCAADDHDGDGMPDTIVAGCTTTLTEDTDDDNDFVDDTSDACPLDINESVDTDGDTICDGIDDDDDADGVVDASDAFPLNANEQIDTDGDCGTIATQNTTSGDGCGDNSDDDIDGDGYLNADDAFDLDNEAWTDTDNDGLADDFPNLSQSTTTWTTSSTLSISDSFSSSSTIASFTLSSTQRAEVTITNTDGYSSECIQNVDSAGWYYCSWSFMITTAGAHTVQLGDTYGDGGNSASIAIQDGVTITSTPATSPVGTLLDYDDDGDNVLDVNENAGCELIADCDGDLDNDDTDQFPLNPAEWDDTDGDAPSGSDGTGYGDNSDAFPLDACANVDTDLDGMPDSYIGGCTSADTSLIEDNDDDGDGVLDAYDDFDDDDSETTDTDGDTIGDNADTDDDNDGYLDADDWSPLDSSEWWDTDADGIGNNADYDDDGDGLADEDDLYPVDKDNDQWDDLYEEACGTDKNDAQSTPVDTDGDTVKLAYPGALASGQTDAQASATNLCDALDTDDDNDGYLDVDDAFRTDDEVWIDTDGDGMADYIDPNSSQFTYATVQLCGTNVGTGTGGSGNQPNALGNYLTVTSSDPSGTYGSNEASCTFTLPAGNSMDIYVQTKNYGGEGVVVVIDPNGAITQFNGFSSYSFYTLNSDGTSSRQGSYITSGITDSSPDWSTAGAYTIIYGDTWGDSCNPSTYSGACFVQATYQELLGTVPATITDDGVLLDYDDDNDGYTDLDETTNCDTGAYASTSDTLDSTSIPADMDNDFICDALDTDRDGDTYDNSVDLFPDDPTDWVDFDGDNIGDNADTDDDADGVLDVDDVWSLNICVSDDFDGDGMADSVTEHCDLGYTAYVTHASAQTTSDGFTDGDYVGVTDYTGHFGGSNTGSNHYQVSDSDGIFSLNFDPLRADSVSLAVAVADTGWESADYLYIAFVGSESTVVIYDSTGTDLDDSTAWTEGVWTTMTADISAAGGGHLTFESSSNSASEAFGIDSVVFSDSSGATIAATDFEYLGGSVFGGMYYDGVGTDGALPGYYTTWAESSSLTATVSASTGTAVTFTLYDGQRANITLSFDSWPSECGMIIDGVSVGCTDVTLTTAGSHSVQMTDSYGDGGSAATISIQDGSGPAIVSYSDAASWMEIDADDDNDGYDDHLDDFHYDVTEWVDTDSDGTGNNADLDDDGDGTYDIADPFPLDLNAWTDTDGDGLADSLPPLGVSTEYTLWR
ncbi:MAG: beta strand repeat-containing protein [Candidatus Thalassarchaeaceae archaeon]